MQIMWVTGLGTILVPIDDIVFHQCSTGLRGSDGLLVKKATGIKANHPKLRRPFVGRLCTQDHPHSQNLCPVGPSNRPGTRCHG